ncbi:MAG: ImmA/IrrE family metallo-endopeptidase [Verrucomicrobia bacterium]|nr:ImmA/IrrE family metallo-endopeptidase [Verrucomicrobiota bacterium]
MKQLWVESPDEIDLLTLAHQAGSLRIEDGGLDNAEGRIVAPGATGGTIRVKAGMNRGRRRFTIAHEIGHYILHPREGLDRDDTAKNFTVWNDPGEEAEANLFAAELLMPEFLFKPRIQKPVPSLAFIDQLASEFSTSTMATAFQYANYTIEQVALVVSIGGKVKWFHRAKDFWPQIRTGTLHPHSGAGEIVAGKSTDTKKMVRSPAYAWLSQFENDTEKEIMEDSRYLDWYDCVVTLLWLYDDLEE